MIEVVKWCLQGSGDEYVQYQPALQPDNVRLGTYGGHSSGGASDEDDFVNTVPFEPQLAPPGIELQARPNTWAAALYEAVPAWPARCWRAPVRQHHAIPDPCCRATHKMETRTVRVA